MDFKVLPLKVAAEADVACVAGVACPTIVLKVIEPLVLGALTFAPATPASSKSTWPL